MPLGQRLKLGQCLGVNLAAVLANAAEQPFSRSAEGSTLPAGALFPGFALLSLQDPLQRVIDDPPVLVELGYEPI